MHLPSWGHPHHTSSFFSARLVSFGSALLGASRSALLCAALLVQPGIAHAQASATAGTSTPDGAPAGADGEATPPSAEELATAKMHFANGVELLQATPPNYQDAFRQFQLAYEKTHGSWKVMGNLGLCALKLERDGEALRYYEGYLKDGGDQIDPDERSHIEREMLLIQGNMAHVVLRSSQPGVRYSVSRQGSAVPPQIYESSADQTELGLRAGTLDITATAQDGSQLTFNVTLAAGERAEHLFDYDAKPIVPEPAPAVAPSEPAKKSGMSGLRIAGIATAGVGVLALGGGVVTGLMSQSKEKNAKDECIDSVCREDTQADFDSAKTLATVANVLFISGGVLAATGITLVIVGGNRGDGSEALASARPVHASLTQPLRHARAANPLRVEIAPAPYWGGGGLMALGSF